MRKLLLATACSAALVFPALAQPPGLWDHNGSAMRLVYNNGHFGVYYERIRPGLVQTIPPGAPRFEGQRLATRSPAMLLSIQSTARACRSRTMSVA